jgi:hypothetical protein
VIVCHPERSEGSPADARKPLRRQGSFAVCAAQDDTLATVHACAAYIRSEDRSLDRQAVSRGRAVADRAGLVGAVLPDRGRPAHLYNAWVLRELALGHDNAVTRTFAIDAKPYPNLLDHIALALLLGEFPPRVAEKVFVSGILLLFLGGLWLFAGAVDARASLFAFLGVPLAHHLLLQSGFYNFSLGAGLYFITVAVWWRRRERDDSQTIAIVAS